MSRFSIALLGAALSLAAFTAHAAGLGRLTVFSALGQPLNAEIEIVSLQPGEEEALSARLASGEAFRQAGIEPSAVLSGVRFAIERRGGRPVIRLTSQQPVNEPFLDLLVELQWNTGRLVREYTFLLDPPNYKGPQPIAAAPAKPSAPPAAKPLPPLEAKPDAQAQAAAPKPAPAAPESTEAKPAAAEAKPATPDAKPPAAEAKPAAAEASDPAKAPASASSYEVKQGDTLGAIARQHLAPGVSLNQMLIALYRANQDAFLRENINLVRSGRILSIPSAEAAAALEAEEVNRLVQSHRAEFEDYRARLAAAPARAEAASGEQSVAGTIDAKPEAAPPAAAQDQVRLSRADPAKPGAVQSRAARGDDAAARERALGEAQSRITDLEKNVADLQKLLELKNQQLAELERKASEAKPAPVKPEAAKPQAEAVKPQAVKPEPAKPAPAVTAEAPKAAPAPAPVPVPTPGAAAPQLKAEPAPEAKKAEPALEAKKAEPAPEAKKAEPAPKPKAIVPPPPPPAPSLLDEFLENPIALAGLALIVLLLLGYAAWAWRRKKATQERFQEGVFGAAGGGAEAVPAAAAGAAAAAAAAGAAGEAQAAPLAAAGATEGDEVDPIAEADVYMAYGRDAQAEEILKEALQRDASRTAVHAKLLEIYARRHDARAFEETALKLKGLTNGTGAEWDKAAALGRSIDPGNGLYGGGEGAAAAAPLAAAAAAPVLDFDVSGAASAGGAQPDISFDEPAKDQSTTTIVDFDVGAATLPVGTQRSDLTQKSDFTPEGTLIMDKKEPEATIGGLDFDLSLPEDGEAQKAAAPSAPAPQQATAGESSGGLDFDLNLDLGTPGEKSAAAEKPAAALDLSAISLDLGSAGEPAGMDVSSNDPKWQEVATKLDLAKAYEEMGDKDGARELLNEVMKDGDAAQKGQAEQILAKLG